MIRAILLTLLSITALALTDVERAELIAKNLMTNPGGERVTQGWANVGGTFTHTTTAAQVASGNAALNFDADASGDALDYTPVAIPQGAYKNVGVARCYFKGASAITHKFQVHDGTNILAEDDVTSSTDKFTATSLYFSFPNSGSVGLSIVAQADEAATYIDDCYIGLASGAGLSEVSQAEFIGTAYIDTATNCAWTTTSSSFADYSTDSDCPGPTVGLNPGGGTIQTTDADLPQFTVNDLEPGLYRALISGIGFNSTTTTTCHRISDGSTTSQEECSAIGSDSSFFAVEGYFDVSTGGDKTFKIQSKTGGGTYNLQANTLGRRLNFSLFRIPNATQQAFNFDSVNWKVDATIAGASINLGTGAVASLTGITNSGLTLTNNTDEGSDSSVQVGCSSTNPPTGSTCSVGDESVSVSFIIPRAGNYEVCANFAHEIVASATGTARSEFAIVETATNAQTALQTGRLSSSGQYTNSGTQAVTQSMENCQVFNFSSVGRKMLRLFYKQTTTAGSDLELNIAPMKWTVRPLDVQYPAPVINNSVTSNGDGPFRIESAYIDNGAGAACSSNPCTVSQETGDWLGVADRDGTGDYGLNLQPGIFSSAPNCITTSTQARIVTIGSADTSSIELQSFNTSAGGADAAFYIMCMGPR